MLSPSPSELERFCDKVERLLQRHAEMARSTQALQAQLTAVRQERDELQQRLDTARNRVDALLERLAEPAAAALQSWERRR